MARNVEKRIAEGKWFSFFTFEIVAALFYPGDAASEERFRARIHEAIQSGELVPAAGPGRLSASDLAGWPECPRVPARSPLRYWLPAFMHEPVAHDGIASLGRGFDLWESKPIAVGDLLERMAGSLHSDPLRRAAALLNLREEVERLAVQNAIPVRNPLSMERLDPGPGEYLWRSVLFPEDAQRFAAEHGVRITIRPQGTDPIQGDSCAEPVAEAPSVEKEGRAAAVDYAAVYNDESRDWRERARARASEWWIDCGLGTKPNRNMAAGFVERWCRDNSVRGHAGTTSDAKYIRNHVLDPRHWDPPPR